MIKPAVHRQIFLLHPDPEFQRMVRSSLAEGFGCWTVPDWKILRETARSASAAEVAVVDALGPDAELSPELRAFVAEFPQLPVIAVLPPALECVREVRTLREWGVAEVIVRGVEDTPEGIASAVRHAQGTVLRGVVQEILPAYIGGGTRRLLLAAAEAVATGGHAPDLAAALGVTETTVMRRCERLRLPPPRRLLAWMRVLLAARLLDQPGRTSRSVAYACGYATEAGLRRVLQSFLGKSVTELRERGAVKVAAGAFLRELRELRSGARQPDGTLRPPG